MFVISKCCVGIKCRYNGKGFLRKIAIEKGKYEDYIAVCPEMLGGLKCPREGCKVIEDKVVGRKTGTDYTAEYLTGAQEVLNICKRNNIDTAYLLKNSPSCGKGYGITAKMLEDNGITVIAI